LIAFIFLNNNRLLKKQGFDRHLLHFQNLFISKIEIKNFQIGEKLPLKIISDG